MYYKRRKAAWVLEENERISEQLGEILRQILKNRELLRETSSHIMNPAIRSAADNFIKLVEQNYRETH
jgi:UDP-N-acetylglucosamine:LPS N-acetylglucosamine transferase